MCDCAALLGRCDAWRSRLSGVLHLPLIPPLPFDISSRVRWGAPPHGAAHPRGDGWEGVTAVTEDDGADDTRLEATLPVPSWLAGALPDEALEFDVVLCPDGGGGPPARVAACGGALRCASPRNLSRLIVQRVSWTVSWGWGANAAAVAALRGAGGGAAPAPQRAGVVPSTAALRLCPPLRHVAALSVPLPPLPARMRAGRRWEVDAGGGGGGGMRLQPWCPWMLARGARLSLRPAHFALDPGTPVRCVAE
eukprot:gene33869-27089_t